MYRINPNKTPAGEIYDYSTFEGMLNYIISDMGLSEYYLNRVDFRVDNFTSHYDDYLKINRLLLLLIDYDWNRHNRYESRDFLTLDNLTLRIQSKRFEVEYYNKREQAPAGLVESRLELRSKALTGDSPVSNLIESWCRQLERTPDSYHALLEKQNLFLSKRYKEEQAILKSDWEFVRRYEGNVFSRQQLAGLFESLGIKNPSKKADNFFDKNRLVNRISQDDVASYVHLVSSALRDYLLR